MDNYEGADKAKIDESTQKVIGNPPPCFLSMQGNLVEYKPEESLTVSFPVLESYLNPAGSMQGGFITAAFDNVFGPLSHAVMKSLTTTLGINTSYHRPIFAGDILTIKATIPSLGKTVVHMYGEAFNGDHRLVASATTDYLYLKKEK